MISLSAHHLAQATGGRLHGVDPDTVVDGPVVVDSRKVAAGSLFVALAGEHVDGAQFASAALAQGAVLVMAAQPLTDSDGRALPVLEVADVQRALGDVARWVLARRREVSPDLKVIAITGSVGKTTTKDLIKHLLGPSDEGSDGAGGRIVAPVGSFNNEIGLPLTVLTMTESTQFMDMEMGADKPGDIGYLAGIAPPDVGVVLRVGTAHLEGFGSRENIAAAKAEMLAQLTPGGVAALNHDDPRVMAMAQPVLAQGRSVVTWGRGVNVETGQELTTQADVCAHNVHVDAYGRASFTLRVDTGAIARARGNRGQGLDGLPGQDGLPGSVGLSGPDGLPVDGEPSQQSGLQEHRVSLSLVGEHHVANALASATAALLVGIEPALIAARLSSARADSPHRMAVSQRTDGITIIDDSYNASPEAMRAALKTLVNVARSGPQARRSVAIVGQMLELGQGADQAHEQVGLDAAALAVDVVLVVGQGAYKTYEAALRQSSPEAGSSWRGVPYFADDLDTARADICEILQPGDVVLVKGSHSTGLWRMADELSEGRLA